jgi:GR25 family glycosyltransferase involved in LPS biosynthesis
MVLRRRRRGVLPCLLLSLLLISMSSSSSSPQHPHVEPELRQRGYALCLDVLLNGRDRSLTLRAGRNSTDAARELLRGEEGVDADDDVALATMVGWVDARTALKVLVRLDVRQRLRRSASPPQLFVSSGGCRRTGALDVQTVSLRGGTGGGAHRDDQPWVVTDFSALNPHDARDWAWLLHGRTVLQRLVLPLPTLRDVHWEDETRDPKAKGVSGDEQQRPPEEEREEEEEEEEGLLRAVKTIAMAARPHLRSGASLTVALPYCGPGGGSTGSRAVSEARLRLCTAVVDWFASSEAWAGRTAAVAVRHCAAGGRGRMVLVGPNHDLEHLLDRSSAADSNDGERQLSRKMKQRLQPVQRGDWSAGALALAAWGRSSVGPTDAQRQGAGEEEECWSLVDVDLLSDITPLPSSKDKDGHPSCGEAAAGAADAVATLVINLARRPDRWQAIQDQVRRLYRLDEACGTDYSPLQLERVDAVDGRELFRSVGSPPAASAATTSTAATDEDWDARWLTSREAVGAQFRLEEWSYAASATPPPLSTGGGGSGGGLRASALNPHPDHAWRPAVVGCALSHLRAWRRIARSAYDDVDDIHVLNFLGENKEDGDEQQRARQRRHHRAGYTRTRQIPNGPGGAGGTAVARGDIYKPYLILEDDAVLSSDFADRFAETMAVASKDFSWDVIFLGVLDDRDLYGDSPAAFSCSSHAPLMSGGGGDDEDAGGEGSGSGIFISEPDHDPHFSGAASSPPRGFVPHAGLRCLLREVSASGRTFGSGLFAYVLRPRAARALLHAAATSGPIMQPIDWWVWEKLNENAFAPRAGGAGDGDVEQGAGGAFTASFDPPSPIEEVGTGGGADPRHLHRLVALKASPPLASSPEGRGRDSDNDEAYSAARFLHTATEGAQTANIDVKADGEVYSESTVELLVRQPRQGSVLPLEQVERGEGLVEIELVVKGPSNLFLEKHKHSLVCTQIDEATIPRDAGSQHCNILQSSAFDATHAWCRTVDDAHLFLPPLRKAGDYSVAAFLVDSGFGGGKEHHVIAKSIPRLFRIAGDTNGTLTIDEGLANMSKDEERRLGSERKLAQLREDLAEAARYEERTKGQHGEEVVTIEVHVDDAPQEIVWRPKKERVYDVSRAFCVERVGLYEVEPAVICMDKIVTRLLDTRREAYWARRRAESAGS